MKHIFAFYFVWINKRRAHFVEESKREPLIFQGNTMATSPSNAANSNAKTMEEATQILIQAACKEVEVTSLQVGQETVACLRNLTTASTSMKTTLDDQFAGVNTKLTQDTSE